MFGGLWATILGLVSGLISVISQVLEKIKTDQLINQGREQQQAEIVKEELDVTRQQTEILTKDQTREETAKKLEDGNF